MREYSDFFQWCDFILSNIRFGALRELYSMAEFPKDDNIAIPMLIYLESEGMINRLNSQTLIQITSKGFVFSQNGGYRVQIERENAELEINRRIARRTRIYERLIVFWTAAAGLGAVGILVWEVCKYFWLECH